MKNILFLDVVKEGTYGRVKFLAPTVKEWIRVGADVIFMAKTLKKVKGMNVSTYLRRVKMYSSSQGYSRVPTPEQIIWMCRFKEMHQLNDFQIFGNT